MHQRLIAAIGRSGRWAGLVAGLVLSCRAGAVTVDNIDFGVAAANPANVGGSYTNFTYFNNVGTYSYGNALYLGLDGNYVLTAYHLYRDDPLPKDVNGVPTSQVMFGSSAVNFDPTFKPVQLINPNIVENPPHSTDLILLKLQSQDTNGQRVCLPSLTISSTIPTVASSVLMIGAGRPQSTSTPQTWYVDQSTNPWTWNTTQQVPPLPQFQGYTDSGGVRVEHWGANLIATNNIAVNDGVGIVASFLTTFDSTTNGGIQYEASAVLNDSGGAVFHKTNGAWQLAGLMYAADPVLSGQPGGVSTAILDSTLTYSADLSFYRSDIYAALVASPSSLWNVDADGAWSNTNNWAEGTPNGANARAKLACVVSTNRTVTLDVARTVGTLIFDAEAGYTLAGTNALTLDVTSGSAALTVLSGNHAITAPIQFKDPTAIDIPANCSLTLSGSLTNILGGGKALTKTGAGTWVISGPQAYGASAVLNANGGVTQINSDAGGPAGATPNLSILTTGAGSAVNFGATQHLHALSLGTNTTVSADANGGRVIVTDSLSLAGASSNSPAATLNLHDNSLIVHNGNLLAVRAAIKAGRSGGTWAGPGIVTDLSTNIPGKTTELAYALGSDTNLAVSSIHGQALASTDVAVKYTYAGDANMDGSVDGLDIALWAVNFTGALGLGPTNNPAKTWTQGDWNFDGSVDGLDAAIWATNFTGSLGGGGLSGMVVDAPGANPAAVTMLQSAGITVVPEPASLILLGLGGAALLGVRRGRRVAQISPAPRL